MKNNEATNDGMNVHLNATWCVVIMLCAIGGPTLCQKALDTITGEPTKKEVASSVVDNALVTRQESDALLSKVAFVSSSITNVESVLNHRFEKMDNDLQALKISVAELRQQAGDHWDGKHNP